MIQVGAISLYLAAAVAANIAVTTWGPWALLITAFFLVPCDLVTRDVLHERWSGPGLWWRMFALVVAGSSLSCISASAAVCVASTIAFAGAGLTNATLYHVMRKRSRLSRMNVSNCGAALVDSVLFPAIAFGMLDPTLVATQTIMKIGGGALWSNIIVKAAK